MFPVDIVYLIADFHHADKQTLAQCSLVCRPWRRPFQTRLFRSIHVSPRPRNSFKELIQFLSSHRDLAAYINTLQLGPGGYIPKHLLPEILGVRPCSTLDLPTLSTILSLIPSLSCLQLDEVSLARPFQPTSLHAEGTASTIPQVVPRFSLDKLSVLDCYDDSQRFIAFEDLRALLSIFSLVRSFHFRHLRPLPEAAYRNPSFPPPATPPDSGPIIRDVEIKLNEEPNLRGHDHDVAALAGVLVRHDTLRALDIPSSFWWVGDNGATLVPFGRRLETLTLRYSCGTIRFGSEDQDCMSPPLLYTTLISVADREHLASPRKPISLSTYPALRTLHAHITGDPLNNDFLDDSSWSHSTPVVPHGLASWRASRLLSDALRPEPPALRAVHIVFTRPMRTTKLGNRIIARILWESPGQEWHALFEARYAKVYRNALVLPSAPDLDWTHLDDTLAAIRSLERVSVVYRLVWPKWGMRGDPLVEKITERVENGIEQTDERKAAFTQAVRDKLPKTCARRGFEVEVCCEVVKGEP